MLVFPNILVQNPIHSPTLEDTTMTSFFSAGGPFMYPILFAGLAALGLTVYRAVQIIGGGRRLSPLAVRTVLHLGIFALLLGIVAQLTGLYQAAAAIIQAENISPQIVAQGMLVSFNTTMFGLYVLLICMLLWLGLRALAQRAETRPAED
jgi:hypothetical protein